MSVLERKVFVVDDELSVRKSLSRLLTAAGFHVETFASARDFLQHGVEKSVSCLVLDMQMPELNGLELQQALAETDRCLPIIFITGHGDIPTSVRAMKAGATDFLAKPFHEKDLLEAIERAHKRSRRELREKAEADEVRLRLATLTSREHDRCAGEAQGIFARRLLSFLQHEGIARPVTKNAVPSICEQVERPTWSGLTSGRRPRARLHR